MKTGLRLFALAVGVVAIGAAPAFAKPLEGSLKGQSQVSQSQCPQGTLVLNVTEKVTGDADSGVAGNAWAFDDYVRHIQVVQVPTDGSFCATINYQGSFTTVSGASPAGNNIVGDGVVGNFDGGYVATFSGTQNSSPGYKTKGSIGTFNYACDGSFNCSGYVDWVTTFFDATAESTFAYQNWGWTYHTAQNGTWVNAQAGNAGDITGN